MKGQVMIILAVIVILVMFLIKIETAYINQGVTGTYNTKVFENLRNELKRAGEITTWKNNYTKVYDFSNFLKEKKDIGLFYSISDFNNSILNITLANFLEENIQDINVSQNLTDETKQISSISEGGTDYVNFTWSGSETTFEVNITYKGSTSGNITKEIFLAKAGPKRYVTVFYDLKLNYDSSYIRDRFSISGETD